jgi:hypothetical protein
VQHDRRASRSYRGCAPRDEHILLMKPRWWNVHAADRSGTFGRTMPVGSPAWHEAEEISERRKALHIFGVMAWMFHFDTVEAKLCE